MGTALRNSLLQQSVRGTLLTPGPGQYNPKVSGDHDPRHLKNQQKHSSFSKKRRELSRSINVTPGPGQYLLPVKFADVQAY